MNSQKIQASVENDITTINIGSESISLTKDKTIDLFNSVLSEYGFLIVNKETFGEMYKGLK